MISVDYTETLRHVVKDGETWDLIAWQYYNDAAAMEPLIRANRQVPIRPLIGAGTVLAIPVLANPQAASVSAGTPPWRQTT